MHRQQAHTRLSPIQLVELLGMGIYLLLSRHLCTLQSKECTIANPPPINPATSHEIEILPSIAEFEPCLLEPEFEPELELELDELVTTVWLV